MGMKRLSSIKIDPPGTSQPITKIKPTIKWVGDLGPGDLVVDIAPPSEQGAMMYVVPGVAKTYDPEDRKHKMKYEYQGFRDSWVCWCGKRVYDNWDAEEHIEDARDYE